VNVEDDDGAHYDMINARRRKKEITRTIPHNMGESYERLTFKATKGVDGRTGKRALYVVLREGRERNGPFRS